MLAHRVTGSPTPLTVRANRNPPTAATAATNVRSPASGLRTGGFTLVAEFDRARADPDCDRVCAMSDCLFCRIVAGEIPSTRVYEDEDILAFEDIQPQAPVHVLVIPKKHIPTLNDLGPDDVPLAGRILEIAVRIARDKGTAEPGFRAVINVNPGGGQVVYHLHLHVLGGRNLKAGLG
jgi:histidine triad (HIT) family protein